MWHDLPQLNHYVARCQSILQSGTPANDILLYWPIDDLRHNVDAELVQRYTVHSVGWLLDTPFGRMADQLQSECFPSNSGLALVGPNVSVAWKTAPQNARSAPFVNW